jgi:hypothetical protein
MRRPETGGENGARSSPVIRATLGRLTTGIRPSYDGPIRLDKVTGAALGPCGPFTGGQEFLRRDRVESVAQPHERAKRQRRGCWQPCREVIVEVPPVLSVQFNVKLGYRLPGGKGGRCMVVFRRTKLVSVSSGRDAVTANLHVLGRGRSTMGVYWAGAGRSRHRQRTTTRGGTYANPESPAPYPSRPRRTPI